MNFDDLAKMNHSRANRWHRNFPHNNDGWNGADWSNAMAGEAGETCNVVKKLRRRETGIHQAGDPTENQLLEKVSKEIGDTAIYLDLLAQYYGLKLHDCIVMAFNQISEREGFPERLQ